MLDTIVSLVVLAFFFFFWPSQDASTTMPQEHALPADMIILLQDTNLSLCLAVTGRKRG